ncbi:hypothetical protein ACJMK2_007261 [Sinanodonta woodiana]|uniref:SH3 domain-binding glutamic acid-rich-like protein n=1 Tax=Sinanodonta woodiana TaxID=1069815 RepID=A0ABD3VIE9_SINWO
MTIKLYMTSITTSREIFNRQTRIKQVLDAKGIEYEEIDLSKDQDKRNEMREKAGIPDLLPPALFNENIYCGDFETFEDAVEDGTLKKYLGLE